MPVESCEVGATTCQTVNIGRGSIADGLHTGAGIVTNIEVLADLNLLFRDANLTKTMFNIGATTRDRVLSNAVYNFNRLLGFFTLSTMDGDFFDKLKLTMESIFNLQPDVNIALLGDSSVTLVREKIAAHVQHSSGTLHDKFLNEVQLLEICEDLQQMNNVLDGREGLAFYPGDCMSTTTFVRDVDYINRVQHRINLRVKHVEGAIVSQDQFRDYSTYLTEHSDGKDDSGDSGDSSSPDFILLPIMFQVADATVRCISSHSTVLSRSIAHVSNSIDVTRDCVDEGHRNRVLDPSGLSAADCQAADLQVVDVQDVQENSALTYKPLYVDDEVYLLSSILYPVKKSTESRDEMYEKFYKESNETENEVARSELSKVFDGMLPYLLSSGADGRLGFGHFSKIQVTDPITLEIKRERYLHQIVKDVLSPSSDWVYYTSTRGPLHSVTGTMMAVTIQNPRTAAVLLFDRSTLEGISVLKLSEENIQYSSSDLINNSAGTFALLNKKKLGLKGLDPKGVFHLERSASSTTDPTNMDGKGVKYAVTSSGTVVDLFVSYSSLAQYCVVDTTNMHKKMGALNVGVPGSSWYNAKGGIFKVGICVDADSKKVTLEKLGQFETCPPDISLEDLQSHGVPEDCFIAKLDGTEGKYPVEYYVPLVDGIDMSFIENDATLFVPVENSTPSVVYEDQSGLQYLLSEEHSSTEDGYTTYLLLDHDTKNVSLYLKVDGTGTNEILQYVNDSVSPIQVPSVTFGAEDITTFLKETAVLLPRFIFDDQFEQKDVDLSRAYSDVKGTEVATAPFSSTYYYKLIDGTKYVEGKYLSTQPVIKSIPYDSRTTPGVMSAWDVPALGFYGCGIYTETSVYVKSNGDPILLSGGSNGNYSPRSDEIIPAEYAAGYISQLFADRNNGETGDLEWTKFQSLLPIAQNAEVTNVVVEPSTTLYKVNCIVSVTYTNDSGEQEYKFGTSIRDHPRSELELSNYIIALRAAVRSPRGDRYLNGMSFAINPSNMALVGILRGQYDDIDNRDHDYITKTVTVNTGIKDDGHNRDETGGNVICEEYLFSGSKSNLRVCALSTLEDLDLNATRDTVYFVPNEQRRVGANGLTIFSNCCQIGENKVLYTMPGKTCYGFGSEMIGEKLTLKELWKTFLPDSTNGGATVVNDIIYLPTLKGIYALDSANGRQLGYCAPGDFGFGGGGIYARGRLIVPTGFTKLGNVHVRPGDKLFALQFSAANVRRSFSTQTPSVQLYESLPNSTVTDNKHVPLFIDKQVLREWIIKEETKDPNNLLVLLMLDSSDTDALRKSGIQYLVMALAVNGEGDVTHPGGDPNITSRTSADGLGFPTGANTSPEDRVISFSNWNAMHSGHSLLMAVGLTVACVHMDATVSPYTIGDKSPPLSEVKTEYTLQTVTPSALRNGVFGFQHVVSDMPVCVFGGWKDDAPFSLTGLYNISEASKWPSVLEQCFKRQGSLGQTRDVLQSLGSLGEYLGPNLSNESSHTFPAKFPSLETKKLNRGQAYLLGELKTIGNAITTIAIYTQSTTGDIVMFNVSSVENMQLLTSSLQSIQANEMKTVASPTVTVVMSDTHFDIDCSIDGFTFYDTRYLNGDYIQDTHNTGYVMISVIDGTQTTEIGPYYGDTSLRLERTDQTSSSITLKLKLDVRSIHGVSYGTFTHSESFTV